MLTLPKLSQKRLLARGRAPRSQSDGRGSKFMRRVIQTGLRLEGTRSCIQKDSTVTLPVLMHQSSLRIHDALTVPFAALIRGPQVRWTATPNLSLRPSMSAGASLEDLAMPTARRATRGNGFRVLRFRC